MLDGKRKTETKPDAGPTKRVSGAKANVNPKRIRELRSGAVQQGPVIYWMSRDQRVADNWALIHACEVAAKNSRPVAVAFNLVTEYLHAGARQFVFMLRALRLIQPRLEALGIPFFLLQGDPSETIPRLVRETGAGLLVTDFVPLRLGRQWRDTVAQRVEVAFHEVDAHNVVPVWIASDKREYSARTIRPKITNKLPEFLTEFPQLGKQAEWSSSVRPDPIDWDALITEARQRGSGVPEVSWCDPGEDAAMEALSGGKGFLSTLRLANYPRRNDPTLPGALSGLSPWLHFGQLSPQRAAIEAIKHKQKARPAVEAFLEELVIRRELAENFCFYEPRYDSLEGAYDWARQTLEAHRRDKREFIYSMEELQAGQTHDPLWNAAQLEMVHGGKMHGFMRMYWAKKILEWTPSPPEALEIAIYLNDRYELDGRDPNGYVGCMWSIAGLHDQGWAERPVFGKIRYMNYAGCKRKFDVEKYVKRVGEMVGRVQAEAADAEEQA